MIMQKNKDGSLKLAGLFVAPVCAYGLVMTLSVARRGMIEFGRLDLALLGIVLLYVAIGCVGFTTGKPMAVRRLVLVVYTSMATLALCEMPLRLWYPSPLEAVPWPPGRTVATAGDAMPGIAGTIEFTVNSLGLRGREVDLATVETRILAVGGSTTECLYVTDKQSWPFLLQEKLSRIRNASVFVGNAGKSGLLTIHHDYLLKNYPLVKKFEWVIVMVGINDLGSQLRGSYQRHLSTVAEVTLTPTYRNKAYYRQLTPVRLVERIVKLSLLGETVVQDLQGEWYKQARQQRQELLRQRRIDAPPAQFEQGRTTYAANLDNIIETAQRNRQRLVLVTQPSLYRKDLPDELERLLHQSVWNGAHTAGVLADMLDAYNQTLIDVARRRGVDYIDLASMLPKDTSTFYDDVHFNETGSDKAASAIAGFLAQRMSNVGRAAGGADQSSKGR